MFMVFLPQKGGLNKNDPPKKNHIGVPNKSIKSKLLPKFQNHPLIAWCCSIFGAWGAKISTWTRSALGSKNWGSSASLLNSHPLEPRHNERKRPGSSKHRVTVTWRHLSLVDVNDGSQWINHNDEWTNIFKEVIKCVNATSMQAFSIETWVVTHLLLTVCWGPPRICAKFCLFLACLILPYSWRQNLTPQRTPALIFDKILLWI